MEEFKQIISKIEEDYKREIDNIIKSAKIEAEKIEKEIRSKAEKLRKEIIEEYKRNAEKEREKILSLAKLEARKIISKTKEDMINSVIQKALGQIRNVDKNVYKEFLKRTIEHSLNILESKNLEILARDRDIGLIEEILKELNLNFKISKLSSESLGGIIIRDLQNNIELNFTFEKILERKTDAIRSEVAKILFS